MFHFFLVFISAYLLKLKIYWRLNMYFLFFGGGGGVGVWNRSFFEAFYYNSRLNTFNHSMNWEYLQV